MIKNLKFDIPAAIVVFLVALPLCLGIAVASGAPPISGVLSGIVGGIVVGIVSDSHTSVSGPAAGLTAIVISAISSLGSFPVFLTAVMLAGVLQLILGFTKSGIIADYIPNNVIKGLLAAIGIILILKQIPHAFGIDTDVEGEFSFFQGDGENTFSELTKIFSYFNWGAVIIAAISFVILTQWKRTPMAKINFLPASLVVVVLGIIINVLFQNYFPDLRLGPNHLVKIDPIHKPTDLFTFPDMSALLSSKLWIAAFTIAAVASLETLLNLEAVDKLDTHKRISSPNRELVAQGLGNLVGGMIGAIPVTSVIVRSSTNIQSGARTKMSAIIHGVFLLMSILFLNKYLNMIPLASLAAILITIGYKLASIKTFKSLYAKGLNQFIPFVVTVVAIVFTDLLVGILIGLSVSIFYILKSNYKNPFTKETQQLHVGETIRLELSDQVSFLNKASIKNTLWNVEPSSKIIIDARNSEYIDEDVLEIISDFKTTRAPELGIQTNILGLKDHYELEDHIDFIDVIDSEKLQAMSPFEVLDILKDGNKRFATGVANDRFFHHHIETLSQNENPLAIIVSCIDARISPDIIFDVSLGDLVSIRVAGNVISAEVLGSIEKAVTGLGIKLIVVLGHSNCGAVKESISGSTQGNFKAIAQKISRAAEKITTPINSANEADVDMVCRENVRLSADDIIQGSEIIRNMQVEGEVTIQSAFYNLKTGEVDFK